MWREIAARRNANLPQSFLEAPVLFQALGSLSVRWVQPVGCFACCYATTPNRSSASGNRSLGLSGRHRMFHFVCGMRKFFGQLDELAAGIYVIHVFDTHSQLLLGNINARLDGENHSGSQRYVIIAGIVNVEANVMAETVNEIFPERLAMQVLAVAINVVIRDVMKRVRLIAPEVRLS